MSTDDSMHDAPRSRPSRRLTCTARRRSRSRPSRPPPAARRSSRAAPRATARICASSRARCSRVRSSSRSGASAARTSSRAGARDDAAGRSRRPWRSEAYTTSSRTCCSRTAAPASAAAIAARPRRQRLGKGLPGAAPPSPSPRPQPRPEPTGVIVAGTVRASCRSPTTMLRNPDAQRLADAAPRLQRHELQPARANHRRQRQAPAARVDLADARRRHEPTRADRLQRHDVSREHRRHRASARRAHGQPDLGAPRRRRHRAARHRALRQQADLPERRGVGHSPAGSALDRARRAHRRDRLEREDAGRLRHEQRPARRERAADPRHGHVHRLREQQVLHQRVRSGRRQAALALSHGRAHGRARRRQLGRPAGSLSRGRGERGSRAATIPS